MLVGGAKATPLIDTQMIQGNGGLTIQEERSHFAAWVFLKVRFTLI